jgi:hypothetical protein
LPADLQPLLDGISQSSSFSRHNLATTFTKLSNIETDGKMRTPLLLTALLSGAAGVSGSINAAAVRSQTPYSCNAVGGVGLTFEEDLSIMHAKFPDLQLYVDTPSHGFPPSYSIMQCLATVEYTEADFSSGYSRARFAISSVTWSNSNLALEKGDNFKTLRGKVDLDIEVSNETSPVQYPIGKDRYSSNLVSLQVEKPGFYLRRIGRNRTLRRS